MSVQNQWRQCANCLGLFFAGSIDAGSGQPDLGHCPATSGPHLAQPGVRLLAIRNEQRPGAQDGWGRCTKCQWLYYVPNAASSVCPLDNAPHTVVEDGAEQFAVGFGNGSRGAYPGWRWCNKCEGLWHAASPGGGSCPEGGSHATAGSAEYALEIEADFVPPVQVTALAAKALNHPRSGS